MLFVDNIDRIKLRIKEISELVRSLQEENLKLKGKVLEQEQALKEKEIILRENKKKFQAIAAIERENKRFQMDRETLQETVNNMLEELRDL